MTDTTDLWKITSAQDAARARVALARLAVDAGAPPLRRARFLTDLAAHLRHCLGQGGVWELLVQAPRPAPGHRPRLRITLRPAGHQQGDGAPWQRSLDCAETPRLSHAHPTSLDDDAFAEAVLASDEDTAALLDRLEEAESLLAFHREELHQTNQGVVAIHADLEAAALVQKDLLAAEQAARAEAENARRLLTFLADASDAVTASLDHEDILGRLPDLLVPGYAARVDVWLFDEDEHTPHHDHHPAAAVAAARTGRPQHAAAHPGALPGVDDLPPSALAPAQAVLCIPLTARRLLGVLILTADRRFAPDESVMLVELARRTATALDNARRYEQHRDTAEALQRAQLTDLPAGSHLHLAARYLPATHGLNIGGDWYDAFLQPDGSLLAVIGDVTGHGLRAAVMMGQLRTALRAYAFEGDGPGRILTRLHGMLRHLQPELYATAAVVRFRPGDPHIVWAAAGHPPPVVRAPDGSVRILDSRPGIMLGIPMAYEYQDHTAHLPPGSTLALYTDGLVERRSAGIDVGIDRLTRALASLAPTDLRQDLDAAAETLLEPMLRDSERDDDVCLLLCHTRVDGPAAMGCAVPAPRTRPAGVEAAGGEGGRW
ncbi:MULTISPECIES: GAF domain-containing SpoIIE family protein phosphatase [unclassified Streptomyces]|uniref:PP2C family protein-serine/threonine phosphatase n=1 Tax=unclassified Streptomyces TaxID=2593676 RepID=UPI0033E00D5F